MTMLIVWSWDHHAAPILTGAIEVTEEQYPKWANMAVNQKCELLDIAYRSDGYFNWNVVDKAESLSDEAFTKAMAVEPVEEDE